MPIHAFFTNLPTIHLTNAPNQPEPVTCAFSSDAFFKESVFYCGVDSVAVVFVDNFGGAFMVNLGVNFDFADFWWTIL